MRNYPISAHFEELSLLQFGKKMKGITIRIFWILVWFLAGLGCIPSITGQTPMRRLGAYYFGAGYFTLVPQNIRHDLDEIKAWGTDLICIGITENDVSYNKGNIDFIVKEAHLRKMKVFAVPSWVAGITAGQPLEPALFPYHFPQTAALDKKGKPIIRKAHGLLCSFYHPEVKQHFKELTGKMLDTWPLDGIVWDEPKSTYWQDFSPLALQNNPDSSFTRYLEDFVEFLSDVNGHLKTKKPALEICLFDEACRPRAVADALAKVKGLDYFGTDGKPVLLHQTTITDNRSTKIMGEYGEYFLKAARTQKVKTLALIENQELTREEVSVMEKAVPALVKMDIDLMLYYYYGFYDEDQERKMQVTKDMIRQYKKPK